MPILPMPNDDLFLSARAKRRMQRRLFLKAGALGLSLPMAARLISSATASTGDKPRRFMMFYMPHGIAPEHCNPVGTGSSTTNFALDQTGVSIFSALEPYKSQLNIYEGFKYQDGDTHSSLTSFLSNTSLANDTTSPRTSIEHYIGNELGTSTLALGAMAHTIHGLNQNSMVMWDGQAVAPEGNPLRAYDEVFGSFTGDPDASASEDELRASMLSLTEGQVAGLRNELSSLSSEQSRLQTHLDALAQLKATSGNGENSCSTVPSIEAIESLRAKFGSDGSDWHLAENNFQDVMIAQMELAAQAMICNVRPVTALQCMYATSDIDFGFTGYGSAGAHHGTLSHTGPQGKDQNARQPFAQAQRWFVDNLVTHVIDKLNVPDAADPGSTVLDNTIILLCSEIGEGAWHGTTTRQLSWDADPLFGYLPLITIGGGGGCLNTGQLLNYHDGVSGEADGAGDRSAGDLWLTLAQAMGVATTDYNGATNPLTEALA